MATSGALDTSNTYIKYKITITENSYSTSGNTSNVTVTVNFYRTNTGYTTYGSGTVYCTIDGTQYTASVTSSQKITNSGIDLFSKTLTIAHNSDGSKSLTVSAYISHSQFTSNSQSFTASLTTIARSSSISSASNVTLGNACSVKWTPASSSYAYKLKFVVGSKSYTTGYISPNTTSAYTYTGYTMSIADWAPYITSATSATCTVTLYTYSSSSSSSSLGSSSATFTVTVPSSVVPTVSIGSVAEGNSAVGIGVYVQNMSTVKVTFTPTMAYSSSLKSYSVAVGSLSYSGTSMTSGSSKTVTSGTLTTSGSITITVTVTDARGRSGTATQTITVYEYSTPAITTFKAQRVDSSGNDNDNGDRVKITYAYSVSSVNGLNTCSMTIQYKESTASSYGTQVTSSTALSGSSTITPTTTFDDQKGWDFRITVVDIFNTATSVSSVGTGIVPLSIYWNGTGVGIGKVAETGSLFDIALKTHITATSHQVEIYNSAESGDTGVWVTSWSGYSVSLQVGTSGSNRGVFDSTIGAWQIYSSSNGYIYIGDNSAYGRVTLGNASVPLYLRSSEIQHSGNFANVIVVGSDDTDSERRVTVRTTGAAIAMISSPGGNRGIYDYTTSVNGYMMYSNSSDQLLIGRSTNLSGTIIGNTSTSLDLIGSSISVSGTATFDSNITSGSSSSTSAQRVYAYNNAARVSLSVTAAGLGGIYDWKHDKWIIYTNTSGTVVTNSAIATQSLLDVGDEIETLAAPNFRDPTHETITHISSHTYDVDGKKHLGLTVAELESAMADAGMDPDEYDLTEHWTDEDGNEVGAIRYEELIPMLISEIQSLNTRLDALEEE